MKIVKCKSILASILGKNMNMKNFFTYTIDLQLSVGFYTCPITEKGANLLKVIAINGSPRKTVMQVRH